MTEHASDSGKALSSASSLLEKAAEFRYYLLIMSAILTLDNTLFFLYQKNIFSLGKPTNTPEFTLGNTIGFIGLLSFLLALFFPILRRLLLFAIRFVYFEWIEHHRHIDLDRAYKYPLLIERQALIDRNDFDLDRVAKYNEDQQRMEGNLDLGFAVAILLACNFWVFGDASSHTISQLLASTFYQPMGLWKALIFYLLYSIFVVGIFVALLMSLNPVRDEKIYLPKADDYPKAQ